MGIRQDDRTDIQKKTHQYLVTATDKLMSGWGMAKNGASKVAWACQTLEEAEKVEKWVQARSEMRHVNLRYPNDPTWYPHAAHVHIYVVGETHPALTK